MASINPIHPDFFRQLGSFFPRVATIQVDGNRFDALGLPLTSVAREPNGEIRKNSDRWIRLLGHEAISANYGGPSGREIRRSNGTLAVDAVVIMLAGGYPLIRADMRCVLDDGRAYDILAPYTDQYNSVTRLICEVVS